MPLPLLTTDPRQGPIQTRHSTRSKGKYRLAATIVCLLSSTLFCGCAAGLMAMPGAAMLADRFGSDKDEEKVDDEKDQDSKKSKKSKLLMFPMVELPLKTTMTTLARVLKPRHYLNT